MGSRRAILLLATLTIPLLQGGPVSAHDPATADDADRSSADPVENVTIHGRRTLTATSTLTVPASDFGLRALESGGQLLDNLTGLLPVRVHNGTIDEVTEPQWKQLESQRSPTPYNGVARDLFAADLLAVHTGELILPFEEEEKDLLNLNEAFGIRGAEGDAVIEAAVAHLRAEALQDATDDLAYMTLNVFDGEFPRTFLQTRNLHFTQYRMDQATNNADHWTLRPAGPSARVPRARSERDWFDLWPR